MSTIQDNQTVWSVNESANSKYEKCLNITEEIYKRINITFQIKKLETATQSDISDQSDQSDINELSNETDLFACDKSSISSSTEAEKPIAPPTKFVNINNNEEKPKPAVVYKRPRKRFRKRVKKRQVKPPTDSDGSSDEALPLSRIVDIDIDKCDSEQSPDNVMGVPHIIIVAKGPEIWGRRSNRVKKRQVKPPTDSDGSSDEALPLSRIVDIDKCDSEQSLDIVMGVPHILIVAKDSKPKKQQSEEKLSKKVTDKKQEPLKSIEKIEKESKTIESTEKDKVSPTKDGKSLDDRKNCNMCSLSFRGDRGLRRHMTMSHIVSLDTKPNQAENTETKKSP